MGNTFSSDDQQQPQYPAVQQTQPRELSQKHQKNCDQLNQTDFGFTGRREYESEYKGRQMTAAERAAFTELMEDDIYDDYKAIKKLIEEEEEEEEGKEATPKKANTDPINEHYETLDSDTEEDENKTKLGDSTSEAKDGQSAPETANTDGGSGDDDGDEDDGYAANPKGSITYELDFRNPGTQKVYSKATSTGDITWRISAIPLGFRNTHLALFIEIVAVRNFHQGESFRTRFTLHLENRTRPDSTQFHQCEHEFRKPGEDWGFCEFAQLSEITRPENGYLSSEGALTVHATLEHLPDLIKDQTASAYNTRDATGYVGLRNQGATCYMNSLLQTLYHTSALTQAVFEMPTEQEGAGETPKGRKGGAKDGKPEESIPLALQELFFNMRFAKKAPSTQALTRSFGWDREDAFTQHDVQEFDRVLLDNLESKMVGTPLEGTVKRIFAGRERHSIRCTEVEYESAREEVFYDLSLDVRGFRTLEESFAAYTATEVLDGDNKYMAEGLGLQRAEKSCKFVSFPPVLHIQLKRWTYDPALDAQTKVNDRFEFPDKLDLTPYLDASAPRDEMYAYRLHAVLIHSGGAQSGHYYTFVRPTQAAKWFKFNDEYVTPATLSQVLESSYGGESEYYYNTAGEKTTSGEKFSNACKQQYVVFTHIHKTNY